MKKIMKKVTGFTLSLTLVGLLTPSFGVESALAEPIAGNQVLLNSGWTQEEINDLLSPEEVSKYDGGQIANETTHYVKQTVGVKVVNSRGGDISQATLVPVEGTEEMVSMEKDEFYKELQEANEAKNDTQRLLALGEKVKDNSLTRTKEVDYVIPDGYMQYTMQAYYLGNKNYQLNLRFEWLKDPKSRGIDILALGHGSGLVQTGTQSDVTFTAAYEDIDIYNQKITTKKMSGISLNTQSGGTIATFNLPVSTMAMKMRGYLSYHAKMSNTTNIVSSVEGYYKHKVSKLTVSPSVSWPFGGSLSVSSESTYVTESPAPYFSVEFSK